MNFILDGILVVIVVMFVYDGFKRGLMNALIRMACSLASIIGSVVISSFGAVYIYNTFVKARIVSSISSALPDIMLGESAAKNASAVYESLPAFAENSLELMGISKSTFVEQMVSAEMSVPDIVENMIRPALVTIVMICCSVFLFMILSAIAYALTKATTEAIDITNLRLTDKILGASLGLVQAALMAVLMVMLINAMLVFLPASNAAGLSSAIDNTLLYRHIHDLDIPLKIMSLFGVSW